MRLVLVLLRAAWRVLRRKQESLIKIPANNMYYAAVAFAFIADRGAAVFLLGLVLLVLVFPLSADPLALIPRSRLQVWPLTVRDQRLLRTIGPLLNPMTWVVTAVVLWRRMALSLSVLIAGLFLVAFCTPSWVRASGHGRMLRWTLRFPRSLGLLVVKNLRGLVTTLDFYCALIPASAATAYRVAGLLPEDAGLPMTWVILLCLSTCSQTLFGLDGRGGVTRYQLIPLSGWKVVLAKDLAFLLLLLLMTAALSPVAGLAGGLIALATVRKAAIVENRAQVRWRLQVGTGFGPAIVQMMSMVVVAAWAASAGPLVLIPCVIVWVVSVWCGGRMLQSNLKRR